MNQNKTDERRASSRVALDEPYFVTLYVIGGGSYKIMLSNVSAKGLQADLPAGAGSEEIPGNARVEISGFPEGLEYMNQITGTVVWVTNGYCGIQFEQELEDEHFLDFLDNL